MSNEPQEQISAYISAETRRMLDELSRTTGVKKGHLIDQALRHHIAALRELPQDIVIPTRVVVTREAGERILDRLKKPHRPTEKLRQLMKHGG